MDSGWKNFIKENIWLFLLLFVVVFGLGGYKLYSVVRFKINENAEFNGAVVKELPNTIKQYEANEYKIIEKDDQDLAEFYLSKIVKIWLNDPGELYELCDVKVKESYKSKEDFVYRMNKFKTTSTKVSTVDAYSVKGGTIVIQTNENMQFKLVTNGINDFKITYIGKV